MREINPYLLLILLVLGVLFLCLSVIFFTALTFKVLDLMVVHI